MVDSLWSIVEPKLFLLWTIDYGLWTFFHGLSTMVYGLALLPKYPLRISHYIVGLITDAG